MSMLEDLKAELEALLVKAEHLFTGSSGLQPASDVQQVLTTAQALGSKLDAMNTPPPAAPPQEPAVVEPAAEPLAADESADALNAAEVKANEQQG
jgi:hypothetical protein